MHTFSETGAGVPAFLAKLWRLVEDPETNHLIYWNKDGRSFIIQNQAQFARELLPLNYKHNNMASFIRQLNMYGFHKITSIDNGGLKFDRDEMEFSHPCFKRGHPYLLEHIKRKIATTKTQIDDKGLIKPEAVNKVLSEVKAMRGRQDSLDSRFSVMKQENEALWREIATLRQKHMKQQQIVNKLIQFLVTIVQPSRGNMTGVKRHFQLMINDVPQSSKMRKKNENESGGPVIHELTEELLDEVADDSDLLISSSPSILSPHNDMSNPLSSDMADDVSPEGSSSSNCDQTKQSQSMSSLFYNYDSNLSDDLSNSFNNYQNNTADEIVFNIREVPDDGNNIDNNYMEENVLNTPLVKKEIARARREQKLRLKRQKDKKQRLLQSCVSKIKKEIPSTLTSARQQRQQRQQQQTSLLATVSSGGNEIIPPIKIKTEKDPIDPLMFLNCSDEQSLDPALISPLSAADMQEATAGTSGIGQNQQQQQQQIEDGNDQVNQNEIFNPSDEIITSDIPSDLFEDSTMIGDINLASGSYNQNIDLKAAVAAATSVAAAAAANSGTNNKSNNDGKIINGNTGGITSQSIPSATTSLVVAGNAKDQSHMNNDSNNDVNGLSLIAATAPMPSSSSAVASTSSGIAVKNNSNGKNLTLAKYNNPKYANDDIMRLSTAEEFTTHLDNVQEDLDNLRDLLRGDGYSLDANTLLGVSEENQNPLDLLLNLFDNSGYDNTTPTNRFVLSSDGDYLLKLFSDSDVLAPYGLTISNEYPADGDKKGSELMSYQPYYADLADILDIDSDTLPKTTTDNENYDDKLKSLETPNSVLNTPYRE